MSLKIKGKITKILPMQTGTSKAGNDWSKLDFLVEEIERDYPKTICFTLFGDKIELLEHEKVGNTVDVSFNLESREYNGKYFHNVNAWKIETLNESAPQKKEKPVDDKSGDLPF